MGAMSDRYQAHVDDEREPSGASGPAPVPLFGMSDQLGRIALPAPVTFFVGRTREIPALRALLLREDVRPIPLTGTGESARSVWRSR
jgi:hypothetical protein